MENEIKKYPQVNFRIDKDVTNRLKTISADVGISQAELITEMINALYKSALKDFNIKAFENLMRRCAEKKGLTVDTDTTEYNTERIKELETERTELKKELHAERIHSRLQSDRWDDERARLTANLDQERADNKKLHGILTALGGKIQNTSLFGVKRLKNDAERLFLTVTSSEPIQYDQ